MANHRGRSARPRSLTIGLRLIARQLRFDGVVVVSIFLAVFLSGVVLIATPRLFEETSDEALQVAVRESTPPLRNLALLNFARIGPRFDDNPLIAIKAAGDRFLEEEVPASVHSIITEHSFLLDSPQFRVSAFPGDEEAPFDTFLRMRYQEGVEDHTRVVAGTLPQPRDPILIEVGDDCVVPGENALSQATPDDSEEAIDCEEVEVPLYELAVTEETLAELRVDIGDRLILTPDANDFLYRTTSLSQLDYMLAIEISGLIEPLNPDAEFWYDDDRLHRPRIVENPDFVIIFATGLTTPADYRSLSSDTGLASWWFTWRYFVDANLVDASSVDALLSDVRTLEANFPPALGLGFDQQRIATDLSDIIEGYLERRTVTAGMLSLAMVGLFAVAVAVVVLLSALVTSRQQASLVLLRSRGASKPQLVASRITQGALLSIPAAALAYVIATQLAPDATDALSWQIAVLVAAAATTIVVVSALPVIGKDLGSLQSNEEAAKAASARRLVGELLVVAVTLGAVYLLRRRVLIEGSLGRDGSFDPLLALAPVLLGVAAGIITNRLYLLPLRLLAWVGSLRTKLVMFMGFMRIQGQPAIARVPMIVILVAVAVAIFSSIIRLSIAEGQQESTWHAVGADYRVTAGVDGSALSARLDLSSVEAVDASARALRMPRAATTQARSAVPPTVFFLSVDTREYAQVIAEKRADPGLPDFLVNLRPGANAGQPSNPIPVVASQLWLPTRPPSLGEQFSLDLGSAQPVFEVAEIRDQWPGVPLGEKFVISNLEAVELAYAPLTVRPTDVFIRGGEGAASELEETIQSQSQSTRLTSRFDLFNELHDEPFAEGLDQGLRLTFLLSTVFALVAAVASLALTARSRRRDLGYLRTLGSTSRQAVAMTMIEQLPSVIAAVAVGVTLGIGTALMFEPGIDVNAFSGPGRVAELQIDIGAILLVTAGLLTAVLVAVGIFGIVTRKENLGSLMRAGEEQ